MPADRLDDAPDLLTVAASIARGERVDWDTAERTTADATVLDELRVLDRLSSLADKMPDAWGRLTITGEVGRGSHGTVYRAHDPALGIDLALKVVHPRGPGSQALAATAFNDARLLAQVNHPNVVRIFWAEAIGEDIGIAMELVQGRTVREILRDRGALSARETMVIGVELCRALAAVHGARLVHGDIKAGNVMIAPNSRTVLMDFGVGQDLKVDAGRGMQRAGTPMYLAPELFRGHDRSPQSDIYSLGVLLFHMVSGTYPLDALDADAVERHHAEHRPRRLLRDLRPDLDDAFIKVVDRALAERPEDRYRTAGEFETALDHALRPTPPPDPDPWWRRVLVPAGVLAVALLAFSVWQIGSGAVPESVNAGLGSADVVSPPAAVATNTYRIEAAFYRHEGSTDVRLQSGARVAEGDKLSLRIQSSVPVYAWVVNEDDRGKSYLLFPLPEQQLANPLPPGTRHEIPGIVSGERIRWTVSSAGGREHFLVFVSPEPPSPDLQQRFAALATPSFSRPAVAQQMTGELVGALRGVGGLTKAPPATPSSRLSDAFPVPLPDSEELTKGMWVRHLTLENPGK